MDTEVEKFRKFLKERGYPDSLIPVECAWVSLQAPGTGLRIIEDVLIVEEWIDARRNQH